MEVENLCDFYASDYHLSIILMEFLNKINMEKTKIITIFENGIEDEINKVKEKNKYNIDEKINFKSTNDIKKIKFNISSNTIFIIKGSKEYMKVANKLVKENIKKLELADLVSKSSNIEPQFIENCNIKIINCYRFENENVADVLRENDEVIYTAGSKKVNSI